MIELLLNTGVTGWVILINSVFGLTVFLERLFHLHRAEIKRDDFLNGICNILNQDNLPEAISMCDRTPGPVPHVVRTALLHAGENPETMRKAVEQAGLQEVPRLERHLGGLLTAAHISPLLGLLGTVLGLMDMLLTMQRGAPLIEIGMLSGGLWKALITTAAGLTVAIPLFAAYNLLISRIERLLLDMEFTATEIIHFMNGEYRKGADHE